MKIILLGEAHVSNTKISTSIKDIKNKQVHLIQEEYVGGCSEEDWYEYIQRYQDFKKDTERYGEYVTAKERAGTVQNEIKLRKELPNPLKVQYGVIQKKARDLSGEMGVEKTREIIEQLIDNENIVSTKLCDYRETNSKTIHELKRINQEYMGFESVFDIQTFTVELVCFYEILKNRDKDYVICYTGEMHKQLLGELLKFFRKKYTIGFETNIGSLFKLRVIELKKLLNTLRKKEGSKKAVMITLYDKIHAALKLKGDV